MQDLIEQDPKKSKQPMNLFQETLPKALLLPGFKGEQGAF